MLFPTPDLRMTSHSPAPKVTLLLVHTPASPAIRGGHVVRLASASMLIDHADDAPTVRPKGCGQRDVASTPRAGRLSILRSPREALYSLPVERNAN